MWALPVMDVLNSYFQCMAKRKLRNQNHSLSTEGKMATKEGVVKQAEARFSKPL